MSSATVVTAAGTPQRIMHSAEAGCPPVAEGVMAEKKMSAADHTALGRTPRRYPRLPVRWRRLSPSSST